MSPPPFLCPVCPRLTGRPPGSGEPELAEAGSGDVERHLTVGKGPELVREGERYQLDLSGGASLYAQSSTVVCYWTSVLVMDCL